VCPATICEFASDFGFVADLLHRTLYDRSATNRSRWSLGISAERRRQSQRLLRCAFVESRKRRAAPVRRSESGATGRRNGISAELMTLHAEQPAAAAVTASLHKFLSRCARRTRSNFGGGGGRDQTAGPARTSAIIKRRWGGGLLAESQFAVRSL